MKNLKTLAVSVPQGKPAVGIKTAPKSSIPDCCICASPHIILTSYLHFPGLFGVTIRQALFIAPCSHTFHYKCIRPLLESHHPAFSCPLCRTFADLEEDVEVEIEAVEEDSAVEDGSCGAVMNSLAVAHILARPGTAVAREQDRDAGTETEVEPDRDPASDPRARRVRLSQPRMMTLVDLTEPELEEDGEDEEMVDVGLRPQVADSTAGAVEDGDMVVVDAGLADMMSAREDSEGSGSGSAEAVAVMEADNPAGAEVGEGNDGEEPDGTVGGKRKR